MPHALVAALLAAAPFTAEDVAPLLSEGPAAEGKAAYDAGRFADAAARLARSPVPGAAFVRALALLEAGRPREAAEATAGLEAKLPQIADRVVFLRGRALEAAGKAREAAAAYAAVPEGSLRAGEARLARARLAASDGQRDAALEAVAPLLDAAPPADAARPDHGATALLLAGRLAAAEGDAARARRSFLDCWALHPVAPEAEACRDGIAALPGAEGAPPSPADVLRRAEVLLDANRNQAALSLLEPLVSGDPSAAPPDSFACGVQSALGRALRKERSYSRTIETLRPVAEGCTDPEVRVRALYVLAGAASIVGDGEEAVRLYTALAREFPGHSFADDALFFAADVHARAGRVADAREALAALVRDHPGGDYHAEARFRLAWLSRGEGDLDGAVAQLLAIEEREADGYEHARAAYWRARILAGRGEEGRAAALAIWSELASRYPADYYGLLARARLAGDGEKEPRRPSGAVPRRQPGPMRWEAGSLREDPRFAAGVLLLRLGLRPEAAEELGSIDPHRLLEASEEAPEAILLVADLLDRAGDHRAAHGLLRTRARAAFRRPPDGENVRVWRIAYPPAYRAEVERWAAAVRIPPDLVQALMREESALDPLALSPAGAVGLTQLMLPTAQEVARSLRLGKMTRARLTDASLNIRLGSRYLATLVKRFGGSIPLALAAYNAGGGAVSRWLEQRKGLALDEFVEEIPVAETRGYVKRVLRSYAAYQLLRGHPVEPPVAGLLNFAPG